MSKGISKLQIENALKDMKDEGIDDNFVGVFPSSHINKFINHAAMISEKKGKHPFVIANTDSSEKGGIHWWSILDIEPKREIFCYYSFGLNSLKNFTIQDNRNVIEKILLGTEKMTRTANKITFFNIWFNLNACKNLSTEELVQVFGNKLKLINFVNIWMVEDRVQSLDSVTCGIFQLYFYNNVFNLNKNSKIQDRARLNKRTK